MRINWSKIKQVLLEALGGFIFWTGCLTPYMIFIVKVDPNQYFKWFFMQLVIIPPLAPLSIRFINWVVKRWDKEIYPKEGRGEKTNN